jgi:alpha-beta hydrolase superfamily lysophospholipase
MKSFEIGAKKTKVFFLHGLRGHGLSQQAALQHMVKNLGISLISLELDGHGEESIERHCLVPPYELIVARICEEIRRQATEAEQVVLMGYSFGATLMLLAADTLQADDSFTPQVTAFIGVSTAFDVGHNVPAWQLWLSKAISPISRFLFEKAWRLSNLLTIHEMNIDLISSDKMIIRAIQNDSLIYKGRIPLATSAQVYQAGLAAKVSIESAQIPSLLLHSLDDEIALAPNKEAFGGHVKLRLFSTLRHNCIDGISREVVVARRAITQFIADKL